MFDNRKAQKNKTAVNAVVGVINAADGPTSDVVSSAGAADSGNVADSIFSFRRTPKGDLLVSFDYGLLGIWLGNRLSQLVHRWISSPIFRLLYAVVYSLDQLAYKRLLLAVIFGLGLGVGFTFIVLERPDQTAAFPEIVMAQANGPLPEVVELGSPEGAATLTQTDNLGSFFLLPSSNVVYLSTSARLGEAGVTKIGVGQNSSLSEKIKNLALGEEIRLTGDNQGVYSYQVTEIRVIDSDDIGQLRCVGHSCVIGLTPSSRWQSSLTAVVATH